MRPCSFARSFARSFALTFALPAAVLACGLCGCALPEYGYTVMMETQKDACRKLQDTDQRARCLKEADRSYDRYKAESEATRRP